LTRDAEGNLYGTTAGGGLGEPGYCDDGNFGGCGTVFKLTPAGQEAVLYRFTGESDGGAPVSDLVLDPDGNLYGTASLGGSSSAVCTPLGQPECGVVFEITAAGKEKVLHTFTASPDGQYPYSGLLHLGNYLYGTTYYGGTYGCGTVYKITP
jgi:uncharacterized repeat protein (TIGR03803 family)